MLRFAFDLAVVGIGFTKPFHCLLLTVIELSSGPTISVKSCGISPGTLRSPSVQQDWHSSVLDIDKDLYKQSTNAL